jgi:hypothetical protein
MNGGEIIFDMNVKDHPIGTQSEYLLKRWRKFTIYAKSGSYNRTEVPSENLYSTSSVYLYDYIVVSKEWYSNMVYTASFVDSTPAEYAAEVGSTALWEHRAGTFKNSPNATVNNYQLQYNIDASTYIFPYRPRYGYCPLYPSFIPSVIYSNQDEYFEIVRGYPINHFTHKRDLFSLYGLVTYNKSNGVITNGYYKRCQQTISTTIESDGLEDGSLPVQTIQIGNLNLTQGDNVINNG